MEVPPAETAALIRRARGRGVRTVLNLAPALPLEPELLADIDLLVANEGEAASLGDPQGTATRLREALIVTEGSAGATAYLSDGGRISASALAIEPVDTTGAGDAFVGVLAGELDHGLALGPALHRASAAAGLACLTRGAQPAMPDRAAIDAAVARLPAPRRIPS
jgi:ribokinase